MERKLDILTLRDVRTELATAIYLLADMIELIGRKDVSQTLVGFDCVDLYSEFCDPARLDLSKFEVAAAAERLFHACFRPRLGVRPHEDDDLLQLDGLIAMIPRNSFGGLQFHLHAPDAALPRLSHAAHARCELFRMIDALAEGNTDRDRVLTGHEIAAIANMRLRSVRNFVSPSGRKPMCSQPTSWSRSSGWVAVEAFEAFGWLTGRRSYRPAALDPAMFETAISSTADRRHLGRIIAVLIWSNIGQTAEAAKQLGWKVGELDGWMRHGPTQDSKKAEQLNRLLRLNKELLPAAVARIGR